MLIKLTFLCFNIDMRYRRDFLSYRSGGRQYRPKTDRGGISVTVTETKIYFVNPLRRSLRALLFMIAWSKFQLDDLASFASQEH